MELFYYNMAELGISLAVVMALAVLAIACVVLTVVGMWKVLAKMGRKPWASLIPFYNLWELGQGATKVKGLVPLCVGFVALVFVIGIASEYIALPRPLMTGLTAGSWVAQMLIMSNLSRAFGRGVGFAVGLWLLPPVFMMILGFSENLRYIGPTTQNNVVPDPSNQ